MSAVGVILKQVVISKHPPCKGYLIQFSTAILFCSTVQNALKKAERFSKRHLELSFKADIGFHLDKGGDLNVWIKVYLAVNWC